MTLALDIAIVAVCCLGLLRGAQQGLGCGMLRLVIVGGGGWLGWRIGSWVSTTESIGAALPSAFIVLVLVAVGLAIGCALGNNAVLAIRGRERAHGIDAALGAVTYALVCCLAAWLTLSCARLMVPSNVSAAISGSRVYSTVDEIIPPAAYGIPMRIVDPIHRAFPGLFSQDEPELPVAPPDASVPEGVVVDRVADSVVKVEVESPVCSTISSGSGWVVSPGKVVTNAHVVAASSSVTVSVRGEAPKLSAAVVGYDAARDIAILDVPGLSVTPLERGDAPASGDPVAYVGFPWGGGLKASSARVRGTLDAKMQDIYDEPTTRNIVSLRATVRVGNSGGPLVDRDGRVVGTIFASSTTQLETGYALSNADSAALIDQAASLSEPVPTGGCPTHS